jgi:hypothetical protein
MKNDESNTPTRRRDREAISRSAASWETFAVETMGYDGCQFQNYNVQSRNTNKDDGFGLEVEAIWFVDKLHSV